MESEWTTRSGVFTAITDKLSMRLDGLGQYEYVSSADLTNTEVGLIRALNSLEQDDEDRIAKQIFGSVPDINHDTYLGFYSALYCGYVSEGDYRKNGTSGGITTWLLVELLKSGLVDAVICAGESSQEGVLFEYQVVTTEAGLKQNSKSRYYPMELSGVLRHVRKFAGRYAVVGIPSFISDLQRLRSLDPVYAERIQFTVSLLCGHQKTTKYGEAIALQAGILAKDIESIDYRYKIEGGLANDYVTEIVGSRDGIQTRELRSPHNTFVHDWGAGMFKVNFSDYIDDCFGETADISIGDAWLPQYYFDGRGTNVLIARNRQIADLLSNAAASGRLHLDVVDASTVKNSQKGLTNHYRVTLPYRLFKLRERTVIKRVSPSRRIPFLRKIIQDLRLEIAKISKERFSEAEVSGDWAYFEKAMTPLMRRYRRTYFVIHLVELGPKGIWTRLRVGLRRRRNG